MKKNYESPRTQVYTIVGQIHLMQQSMKIGSQKVSNSNDIGFARESNNDYSIWDND